jgi:DNA-binding winged helix-turn-helix (wHTH) protein
MAVLLHLMDSRERVVSRAELLDTILGDRFVSESALISQIKAIRRAVGDTGDSQRIVRTVHGQGYGFVADVQERDGAPTADPRQDAAQGKTWGSGAGRKSDDRMGLLSTRWLTVGGDGS